MYRVLIYNPQEQLLRRIAEYVRAFMQARGESCGVTKCKDRAGLRRLRDRAASVPDILVLDAHLLDGADLPLADDLLRQKGCQVIFVGDVDELAFDAYLVTHVWYVRKQWMERELGRALEKACDNLGRMQAGRVALRVAHKSVVIEKSTILYAEQSLRRIRLLCADGAEYIAYFKMDEMLALLDEDYFVRCHKSYFVNAAAVQEFSYNRILMRCGREIPISKTYARAVSEQLADWFGPRVSVCV